MLERHDAAHRRDPLHVDLTADLVIVGGGMAGTCCAITAARHGLRVVLMQDRPVLGGNASSEVRLWVLGATCHLHSNARWAREGGVIDEILAETLWRNAEANPLIFDIVLLEKVRAEGNITLLLNTAVHDCEKRDADTIAAVRAFNSQNSTRYTARAPLFVDASGDGILGFTAGAAFRMGAETAAEFGEKFAPEEGYGHLLGHSIYFYSKDTGRPVEFTAPSFALKDIEREIPRFRGFDADTEGCRLWWIEWGGRKDTVHASEEIKWELWKVVYGVWDYLKNSGKFPQMANKTLEWVGHIAGKRESRRFEGDAMLLQQDVVGAAVHADDVAFGGWAVDLHPADGVYSKHPGCTHWRGRGIYGIPYRCLYSRNIGNLFLAGRILSASHVAFGSSRVMGTLAYAAQAVAVAAAICSRDGVLPRAVAAGERLDELQRRVMRDGHHLPGRAYRDPANLAARATVSASSVLRLAELPPDGPAIAIPWGCAQLLPLAAGRVPRFTLWFEAEQATTATVELRICSRIGCFTPDVVLARRELALHAGRHAVDIDLAIDLPATQYAQLCVVAAGGASIVTSQALISGVRAGFIHHAQNPPSDIGVDSFDWWTPLRRPGAQNAALRCDPPLDAFVPGNAINGWNRPTTSPNTWVADPADREPTLVLRWDAPTTIGCVELFGDPDHEHPMEHVLMRHHDRVSPYLLRAFEIRDEHGALIHAVSGNHQGRVVARFAAPVAVRELRIGVLEMNGPAPAAIAEVRCYAR
ncbi:MAG TPA: FAD-dependent oxidoreductase [Planctomycetota bacterium]|nr:FAD-dependent oxidoreductase [Planctomycetota bacterium]